MIGSPGVGNNNNVTENSNDNNNNTKEASINQRLTTSMKATNVTKIQIRLFEWRRVYKKIDFLRIIFAARHKSNTIKQGNSQRKQMG